MVVPRRRRLAAVSAGRHFPQSRRRRGDWDRRYHRAALGAENQRARHLPRSGPFFEGTLRQDQRPALVVRAVARPHTLGRPYHGPAVPHRACTVQALLCGQAALTQDTAGLGSSGCIADPPLAARPPDCHRRRHCVRRGRFPRCRPKLCQRRHPIAPRRQSLCPRTTQTTGPRTTGGQGQAPAHTDASAARCRHGLATPHRHALVWPHQSCR